MEKHEILPGSLVMADQVRYMVYRVTRYSVPGCRPDSRNLVVVLGKDWLFTAPPAGTEHTL